MVRSDDVVEVNLRPAPNACFPTLPTLAVKIFPGTLLTEGVSDHTSFKLSSTAPFKGREMSCGSLKKIGEMRFTSGKRRWGGQDS